MRAPRVLLPALAVLLLVPAALAGPADTRVGETRMTFSAKGTALKAQPKTLCEQVATLPQGTRVRVLEVKLPWARVETLTEPKQQGWLKAALIGTPTELTSNAAPSPKLRAGAAGVNQRDVTAAGRQFGPSTERAYRTSKPQLQYAYQMVDDMIARTTRMNPSASMAFIAEGEIYRPNERQDWKRPPLLQPRPSAQAPQRQGRAGTRHGGNRSGRRQPRRGGGLGGLLGGKLPGGVDDVLEGIGLGEKEREIAKQGLKEIQSLHGELSKAFTPTHEYFLGRAVAATAIAKYGLDPDETRRAYVRQVGDAIVRVARTVPANVGGYHFEVLNSDEVNGLSGPGGFVFVTRGLVNACSTEDELAAVLAHELGHILKKHGEKTLRSGKTWPGILGGIGRTATAGLDDNNLMAKVVDAFGKTVEEIARTSMENTYGRAAEFEADLMGTGLLSEVRYDHQALRNMLQRMESIPGAYGQGATHAPASVRRQYVERSMQSWGWGAFGDHEILAFRRQRFNEAKAQAAAAGAR